MMKKIGEYLFVIGVIVLVRCAIQSCAVEFQLPSDMVFALKFASDAMIVGAYLSRGC